MDIKVVARHGDLAEDVKHAAVDKVMKLARYFEGVHWITVTLDGGSEIKKAEVVIGAVRGTKIVAEAEGPDLHEAIDLVIDKAEHQLTKFKEKLKDHRHKEDH